MLYASKIWNREELYTEVWKEPMVKVSARYGISDVALAKVCRKLSIPVPGRGYWAKKAQGHVVKVKSLPKVEEVPRIARYERPQKPDWPTHPVDKGRLAHVDELIASGTLVPDSSHIEIRHPLVKGAKRIFKAARTDDRGILAVAYDAECLAIRVSKNSLDRALLLLDRLFDVLVKQEITVDVAKDRDGRTFAKYLDEKLEFKIVEKVKQVPLTQEEERLYAPGGPKQYHSKPRNTTLRASWNLKSSNSLITSGRLGATKRLTSLKTLFPSVRRESCESGVECGRRTEIRQNELLAQQKRTEELTH